MSVAVGWGCCGTEYEGGVLGESEEGGGWGCWRGAVRGMRRVRGRWGGGRGRGERKGKEVRVVVI